MLDILTAYLNDAVTPELKTAIEEAHAVFERIELPDFNLGFEEILMTSDEVDIADTPVLITNLTMDLQRDILKQHGIITTPETGIEMLTTFITALLDIPDYEDASEVIDIVSLNGTSEDIMSQLMALVTEHSADELIIHLDNVSLSCIVRIKELMQPEEQSPVVDDQTDIRQHQIDTFVRLQHYLLKPIPRTAEMLANGLAVGLPFQVYADLIGRDFESMPVDRAAQELVAIALLSSDGNANPVSMIKEHLEHYVSSLEKVTQIYIAVSDLLIGFKP